MIRFAEKSDIDKLMSFINNNWSENHILSRDRDFFEYEHCDGDVVNFVISLDDYGNINGMQGFIPYGRRNRDITKNLWRALKSDVPHLGSKILEFLIQHSDARSVASIGSNPKTLSIYRRIGFHVGELCQWYRLNPDAVYFIAGIRNHTIPIPELPRKEWVEIKSIDEFVRLFDYEWYMHSNIIPFKEDWYISKRYYQHPIYKYRLFGIYGNSGVRLVLVFRLDYCYGSRALRLIDCIGDYNDLVYVTDKIDALMREEKAEYVDFYESGINAEMMRKAGWLKVFGSGNTIPNYFSPFEKRNINIYYASSSSNAVYFKGDGDQDRPS